MRIIPRSCPIICGNIRGDEYILAKEYTDESESEGLLVLKCLENGYIEFVKDYDEKCDAMVSLANIMKSSLVHDAEQAVTIINDLL